MSGIPRLASTKVSRERSRKPDPAGFRERWLARQRGEAAPAKARTAEQQHKKALNDVRNAQRRKALTRWQWKAALAHFGHRCAYCGESGKVLHREHFVPIEMGGDLSARNIVPACQSCNNKKKTSHPLLWLAEQDKLALYFEITVWLAQQRKR